MSKWIALLACALSVAACTAPSERPSSGDYGSSGTMGSTGSSSESAADSSETPDYYPEKEPGQ